MPSVRLTSRDSHNWRTHPVRGGPMIPKKRVTRTHSFAMCLPLRSDLQGHMSVGEISPLHSVESHCITRLESVGPLEAHFIPMGGPQAHRNSKPLLTGGLAG